MVYVGCSGWQHDWRGMFYPDDIPKTRWLSYYLSHFNTVELNATFYQSPTEERCRKWNSDYPEDFKLSIKGNRYITHLKKLKGVEDAVNSFLDALDPLMDKVGVILWQLPGTIKFDLERLENFCSIIAESQYPQVIEFRHECWYHDDVTTILRNHGIGFCVNSGPEVPPTYYDTGNCIYIRFHGSSTWYTHDYSDEELKPWAEWISSVDTGKKPVFIFFNNDFAPKNALQLQKLLKNR